MTLRLCSGHRTSTVAWFDFAHQSAGHRTSTVAWFDFAHHSAPYRTTSQGKKLIMENNNYEGRDTNYEVLV